MDKPEHISAAELFTVNKDLGITVSAVNLTSLNIDIFCLNLRPQTYYAYTG